METRDGHGVRVEHSPDIVIMSTPAAGSSSDRPEIVPDPPEPSPAPPRRRLAVILAVLLAVAIVVTLLLTLLADSDDDVVARSDVGTVADQPAGPAPLGLEVQVPADLVAGQAARLVVRWSDGSGIFSGGSEDWGDGVATSSVKLGRCEPTAGAPPAAAGSYRATHTWSEPGTYTVVIGVSTYSCEGGTIAQEEASKTLRVEVLPAR